MSTDDGRPAPPRPIVTRREITAALTELGVRPGDTLLVHSSLRALGWVPGGALAVVQALLDAVGDTGTLVVPTQTGENSDPSGWSRPPVPQDWWPVIRAETPGFDPGRTASQGMGAIPEQVRTWPGASRSTHPQTSFAALGPRSGDVVAVHDLDSQCGERSPLAAMEGLGAKVLLLGAGFGSCTAFHLAEYRVAGSPRATLGAAVLTADGGQAWVTFDDLDLDEGDFAEIGAHLGSLGVVATGKVGDADAHLSDLHTGVDAARAWMSEHRGRGVGPGGAPPAGS